MVNTIPNLTSESVVSGVSEADLVYAMGLGISFNGAQFLYQGFKYDRITDVLSYAQLDMEREGRRLVSTTLKDWLPRPVPSGDDQILMKKYGIIFESWRYKFKDFRYDRLADAVNYARSHQ